MDILIEELHDHIYLKTPYSHDRWKPKAPETIGLSTPGNEVANCNTQKMTREI